MIYVVQNYNSTTDYRVVYAGSSSHDACIAASQLPAVRVRIFKNGELYIPDTKDKNP